MYNIFNVINTRVYNNETRVEESRKSNCDIFFYYNIVVNVLLINRSNKMISILKIDQNEWRFDNNK